MKAVVFHGIGDIRLRDVPEPTLREPTDATVRLRASAICGTDLHFVCGTVGRILGHEGVGRVVEALGDGLAVGAPMAGALDACLAFDTREPGRLKVKLDPHATDGARTPRASRA
ncbi:alcohol dehydrogenase catalytic domain-containing protein [Ralstonia pickettii]|jgi:threonine dehydrogenase-like Zn-dependent dehydrogenase|nr:alcohol dehydrogenase catalytic domain-containing protein [Ralstonia pickettii]MBX4026442.1 alcohol dehydrogenase catalytic domain-containing protein [Ralstonia pickettii]MBX4068307.1 alcohol dehydrogenase catalytic domain-containing protein [Ralstonia pickettii]MBX4073299.1 alcohol dehydrogenase catalytic domain-containing protein [Ralstonia pickettii]MBX4086805.1 alcohol dehydrogenase catalytic domain-containing protein [Ralstonia pickettii]